MDIRGIKDFDSTYQFQTAHVYSYETIRLDMDKASLGSSIAPTSTCCPGLECRNNEQFNISGRLSPCQDTRRAMPDRAACPSHPMAQLYIRGLRLVTVDSVLALIHRFLFTP